MSRGPPRYGRLREAGRELETQLRMFIGMPQRHFVQLCCSSHHIGRRSCGQRLDLDTITKALDFGGEAFDLVWLAASVEVIGAEVFVERSVCDHAVGGWAM